jgi:hypothetical protein
VFGLRLQFSDGALEIVAVAEDDTIELRDDDGGSRGRVLPGHEEDVTVQLVVAASMLHVFWVRSVE